MKMQNLKVLKREAGGKGVARRLRVDGQLPATVYGEGQEPVSVAISAKDFDAILRSEMGENAIVQLEAENEPSISGPVQLKDVQHHPIRSHAVHADFMRIRLDEKIHSYVPLTIVGRSVGIQEGGVPDQQLYEIEVECMALDVPSHIDIDTTDLGIGDSLHLEDIKMPEGVTLLTEPERTIISIHPPRVLTTEEEEAEGEEEGVEPEVVGEEAGEEGGE